MVDSPVWVPDSDARMCMHCSKVEFTLLARKVRREIPTRFIVSIFFLSRLVCTFCNFFFWVAALDCSCCNGPINITCRPMILFTLL